MILVLGGVASGKRTYVQSLGFGDVDIDDAALGGAPVLYGLDQLLHEGPLADDEFEHLCAKEVICCTEVGMGVVPIDPAERAWRELVGRTCARLAERADQVVRMVCGIPLVIKEANV